MELRVFQIRTEGKGEIAEPAGAARSAGFPKTAPEIPPSRVRKFAPGEAASTKENGTRGSAPLGICGRLPSLGIRQQFSV
jgi:hypothetical protein